MSKIDGFSRFTKAESPQLGMLNLSGDNGVSMRPQYIKSEVVPGYYGGDISYSYRDMPQQGILKIAIVNDNYGFDVTYTNAIAAQRSGAIINISLVKSNGKIVTFAGRIIDLPEPKDTDKDFTINFESKITL